jgi:hypothetical protein
MATGKCGNEVLDEDGLKEKTQQWCTTLSSPGTTNEEVLIGSKQFLELIKGVWCLDTSYAVDAAELVCTTLR